jgi:hypothetical protein
MADDPVIRQDSGLDNIRTAWLAVNCGVERFPDRPEWPFYSGKPRNSRLEK